MKYLSPPLWPIIRYTFVRSLQYKRTRTPSHLCGVPGKAEQDSYGEVTDLAREITLNKSVDEIIKVWNNLSKSVIKWLVWRTVITVLLVVINMQPQLSTNPVALTEGGMDGG